MLFRVPIGYVSFNACHVMFLFEVAFVGNKGSSSHVEAAVLLSVGYQCISDRCYTDYTTRDIVTYKRDYALEQVKFCEQALSEFDKEGKK